MSVLFRSRELSQPGGDEWFGRQRAGAKDASCPVPPERTLYRHARLLWFGRFDGVKAILRQMAAAIFANFAKFAIPQPEHKVIAVIVSAAVQHLAVGFRFHGDIIALPAHPGNRKLDRRFPYARHCGSSRSEERWFGKEGVSTCRCRWSPDH